MFASVDLSQADDLAWSMQLNCTVCPAEGAHAFDQSSSDPGEPPSVIIARQQALQNIKQWLEQHNAQKTELPTSNAANLFDLDFALGGYTSALNYTFAGSNSRSTVASLQPTLTTDAGQTLDLT